VLVRVRRMHHVAKGVGDNIEISTLCILMYRGWSIIKRYPLPLGFVVQMGYNQLLLLHRNPFHLDVEARWDDAG